MASSNSIRTRVCVFWDTLGGTCCPFGTITHPLEIVQLGKKSLQQRTKDCEVGYSSLHTGKGDPFITKKICNIWWDLPATHVIKTACCFHVVNVTLAHYLKK